MTKKLTYKEALDETKRLIDGQGTHIDAAIREAVVGLRMHGISTIGSCEGHLDHGYPYPWIDIGTSERRPAQAEPAVDGSIMDLAERLKKNAAEFGGVKIHATVIKNDDWFYVEADPHTGKARKHAPRTLSTESKAHGLEQVLRVTNLLGQFYEANPTHYFTMIGIEPLGTAGNVQIRIQSNGAQAVGLMNKSQQAAKLKDLGQHMNALAAFLIGS